MSTLFYVVDTVSAHGRTRRHGPFDSCHSAESFGLTQVQAVASRAGYAAPIFESETDSAGVLTFQIRYEGVTAEEYVSVLQVPVSRARNLFI